MFQMGEDGMRFSLKAVALAAILAATGAQAMETVLW